MPAGHGAAARSKKATPVAEDVRGRVLAAAVKLIDKDGLAALSMREVARAAGVSHQAPYHYFQDRESILAALAEEGFNLLTTRLDSAVDPAQTSTERLTTLGRVYAEFACDQPALFRLMFRPDFVAVERFPGVRDCGKRAFDALFASVQACVDDGLPPVPSTLSLVVLSWSLVHGLACLLLDGPLNLKLPDATKDRDALIRDVVAAMGALVESARTNARSAPPTPSARARRGATNRTKRRRAP
jgi:AcrR family transcriptional regulator